MVHTLTTNTPMKANTPEADSREQLRQKNLRLALILASVVAVFFLGFVAKVMLMGPPN
jgi:hypothetical protein